MVGLQYIYFVTAQGEKVDILGTRGGKMRIRALVGLVLIFVVLLICTADLFCYDWDCIVRCMRAGGLYDSCLRQCGGR